MTKHLEIKTYEHRGIQVMVLIDYDKEQVSLMERIKPLSYHDPIGMERRDFPFKPKNWVFAKREINYMPGWQDILDAMKYAVKEATQELNDGLVEKEKAKDAEIVEMATATYKLAFDDMEIPKTCSVKGCNKKTQSMGRRSGGGQKFRSKCKEHRK